MLEIKKIGPWKKVNKLIEQFPERSRRMQHVILRDVLKKFRRDVIGGLPKSPEMKEYGRLIQPRRLTGSFKRGEIGYALAADAKKLEMAEVDIETDVLYAVPTLEPISELSKLIIQYSPWTKDTLPENVGASRDIKLISRRVTREEVDKTRAIKKDILKKYESSFREAEAKIPRTEDEPEKPPIMSDLAFMALRMEFGIGQKQVAHWRPAYRRIYPGMREMFKSDKKYGRFLNDDGFTGWTTTLKKMKPLPIQEFTKLYAKFQKQVMK